MAITALQGTFGFGVQSAKGTVATTWYRHLATDVSLGTMDETKLGPPEVGDQPTPTFPYKAGMIVDGTVTLLPRFEDTFGYLLYGLMGSQVSNTPTGTAAHKHLFAFASSPSFTPWMSFRKHIPGYSTADDLGEVYTDCKILQLGLSLAADSPIQASLGVRGISTTIDNSPDTWTWQNTFETYHSVPVGCQVAGHVKVPGVSSNPLPVIGANFTFVNQPLDISQERVYGNPYLPDITTIMRVASMDVVVKWEDSKLWKAILTNSTTGTTWSPSPFTSDIEIVASAPGVMTGETIPYSLKISVPEAVLMSQDGIRLAGNNAVMMRISSTAIRPASGNYCTMELTNLRATNYA